MTEHRDPPPLVTNDMRTVAVGTGLWFIVLVGLAIWHDDVRSAGLLWWYPMCLCGIALGILGMVYLKVRPAQLLRKQQERDAAAAERR